jgi:hypothetical protein
MGTDTEWSLDAARENLDAVIASALESGPQTIIANGRRVIVVDERNFASRGVHREPAPDPGRHLVDLINESPLKGSGVVFERLCSPPRLVDLGDE